MDPRRGPKQLAFASAFATLAPGVAQAHGPLPHGEFIVLDPQDPSFMFVTTNVYGHYFSHDGGQTFDWICPDLFSSSTTFESYRLHGAFLLGSSPRKLMVAGFAGVFTTTDDGCTWDALPDVEGDRMGFALQDPAEPAHVLIGTTTGGPDAVDNAVWQSWDAGSTFQRTGLRGDILIKSGIIHPADGAYYVTSFTNGTWLPSFHRSDDQGETWVDGVLPDGTQSVIHIVGVDPAAAGTVFLREQFSDHDDVVATRDAGVTFETVLETDTLVYEIHHFGDGTMWLGRDGGALVSVDGGMTWSDGPSTPGMTCFERNGGDLYTCTRAVEDQSVAEISRDDGASWEPVFTYAQVNGPLACLDAVDFSTCNDDRWQVQCGEYEEVFAEVQACAAEGETETGGATDTDPGDETAGADEPSEGCSCRNDGSPASMGLPLLVLAAFRRRRALVLAAGLAACSRPSATTPAVTSVPEQPTRELYRARAVVLDLANPRGILDLPDGSLLVAEAGRGDPNEPDTGRLLHVRDADGDGRFEAREVILDRQPSVNIVTKLAVNRDEVFGFADIARGDGTILASVADPQDGTIVLEVDGDRTTNWGATEDNANSLAYHPSLRRWFAVQSFANTVIDARSGETVATFEPLAAGQDAVPSALVYEAASDQLIVALFSGQRGGDVAGTGVDFVERSGLLVRLDPRTGVVTPILGGLNAPVDVAVDERGRIYVLEFCRGFVGPVAGIDEARASRGHGGFERFSGRLLRWVPGEPDVTLLAEGLDLPTHLRLAEGDRIFVSVGQGTPGRTVPGPEGPTVVAGKILELTPPPRRTEP